MQIYIHLYIFVHICINHHKNLYINRSRCVYVFVSSSCRTIHIKFLTTLTSTRYNWDFEFFLEFWNRFPACVTFICFKNYFIDNRVCLGLKIWIHLSLDPVKVPVITNVGLDPRCALHPTQAFICTTPGTCPHLWNDCRTSRWECAVKFKGAAPPPRHPRFRGRPPQHSQTLSPLNKRAVWLSDPRHLFRWSKSFAVFFLSNDVHVSYKHTIPWGCFTDVSEGTSPALYTIKKQKKDYFADVRLRLCFEQWPEGTFSKQYQLCS